MSAWNESDLLKKGYKKTGDGRYEKGDQVAFNPEVSEAITGIPGLLVTGSKPKPFPFAHLSPKPGFEENFEQKTIEMRDTVFWDNAKVLYRQCQIDMAPFPKPRMTSGDKWKKRPRVERYRANCNALSFAAKSLNYKLQDVLIVEFLMPMPTSWGQEVRMKRLFTPHDSIPDCDNMIKAVQDALCLQDKAVYEVHARKLWSLEPKIILYA